jgi:exosome complex component CSL4
MLKKDNFIHKQFKIPGQKIGVIEEFLPENGTYEKEGTIYATRTGYALLNSIEKTVKIEPKTKNPLVPQEGNEIIGIVIVAQGRMAIVDISIIEGKILSLPFNAMLGIANTSPRYERVMEDVCKRGDLIKAKIINIKSKIPQLTTTEKHLGVVKAFCSKCGEPLDFSNSFLHCNSCGNKESRKIAQDYGKLDVGEINGSIHQKRE